ncbi:MAG TPA: SDR family NAD(P)-dependent oxidoreductase [Stellaceae bacterium]|nr:SDR family NAD(P)-dependent oxidoreductase [Stellaceae bacterium]
MSVEPKTLSLAGQTALVTGAAHGFGRAIAKTLADAGATVWGGDVLEGELAETKAACGERCQVRRLDVTDRALVHAVVKEAQTASGRIDILVNDAGGVLGQVGRPIEEITPQQWQSIFDVNVTGAFNCIQAAAPGMKAHRHGRIVNISSGAGLRTSLTGIQAYASAKAAQIGLTRQLAQELGPFGITVNNVAPGFVRSNPTTEKQWASYGAEGQKRLVDSLYMKRLGSAEDIANAVLFFASDLAGWITGQILSVDGGRS